MVAQHTQVAKILGVDVRGTRRNAGLFFYVHLYLESRSL